MAVEVEAAAGTVAATEMNVEVETTAVVVEGVEEVATAAAAAAATADLWRWVPQCCRRLAVVLKDLVRQTLQASQELS